MTTATTPVDTTPRALFWAISEIAGRDRVSKQAVSKKVAQLVTGHGLTVERDGRGRIARVNVAQYDHLRGKVDDPSKAQAPRQQDAMLVPPEESYDEALRMKTWHEAEKRRLELEEMKGNLVPMGALLDAIDRCAAEINQIIDMLPNNADDLAVVVARDGSAGLRRVLKERATKMRDEIANKLEAAVTAQAEAAEAAAA